MCTYELMRQKYRYVVLSSKPDSRELSRYLLSFFGEYEFGKMGIKFINKTIKIKREYLYKLTAALALNINIKIVSIQGTLKR